MSDSHFDDDYHNISCFKKTIKDDDLNNFKILLDKEAKINCQHCLCRENNEKYCAFLLDYVIQEN